MFINGISRRSLLKAGAAGLAASALPFGIAKAQTNVILGIVYVGPRDDFGWNQAHAVAVEALKALPGVTVVEEENVAETDAVSKSMESMINLDGANLILATSLRLLQPVRGRPGEEISGRHVPPRRAALEQGHRSAERRHLLPLSQPGPLRRRRRRRPLDQSGKIGFVAAKPIPSVLSNINSVLLGARKVNPNATVQVIFTGEWSLPVREAEATNALVDAGCDVITCHVDSPKVVIETAEGRGVKTCGHNATRRRSRRRASSPAPSTSGRRSTRPMPTRLAAGETLPNFLVGGYDNGHAANTPYGAGATPEAITAADAAIAALKAGEADLQGPAQGQQRQRRRRQDLRQLRPLPRRHELAARRRRRVDHLTSKRVRPGPSPLRPRCAADQGVASATAPRPRHDRPNRRRHPGPARRATSPSASSASAEAVVDPGRRADLPRRISSRSSSSSSARSPLEFFGLIWTGGFGSSFSCQNTLSSARRR